MAHADESAVLEGDLEPVPRRPGKFPKPLQAAIADAEAPDDIEAPDDEEEPAPKNRKARRAAQSKARGKSKSKDEEAEDEEDGDRDGEHHGDDHRDDDDANPRPSPAEVLHLIMTELTVAPEIAGAAHGIGRNSAYEAIHKGQIVANRVGNKLTCPTAPLRRQLGIDPPLPGEEPAPPIAKKYRKSESPKPRRPLMARASKGARSRKP